MKYVIAMVRVLGSDQEHAGWKIWGVAQQGVEVNNDSIQRSLRGAWSMFSRAQSIYMTRNWTSRVP